MLPNRIDQLTIENFRSIENATVNLLPLTVLIGPNGSGKSNFIHSITFLADYLRYDAIDNAAFMHSRGGIESFRRKSPNGDALGVRLEAKFSAEGAEGNITFVASANDGHPVSSWGGGIAVGGIQPEVIPIPTTTLLPSTLLQNPVYRFFKGMRFYNLFTADLRVPQRRSSTFALNDNADNMSSILLGMQQQSATNQYYRFWLHELYNSLHAAIPSISDKEPIRVEAVGSYLVTSIQHSNGIWLDLEQESDGTLRMLALLTALYQFPFPRLIVIEEPELLIHPAALDVLADVIKEASLRMQVILTTHSPDLITRFDVDSVRIVERTNGVTTIQPIDEGERQAVLDKLFSLGDLMRIGGLRSG